MGLSSTHPVSALQSGPFGLSAAALIRQSGPTRPRSLWRGFLCAPPRNADETVRPLELLSEAPR